MKRVFLSLLLAAALIEVTAAQTANQAILVIRHGEDINDKAKNPQAQYIGTLATAPNNRPWYNTNTPSQTFTYAGPPIQKIQVPFPTRWAATLNISWPMYPANANKIRLFGGTSAMRSLDSVSAAQHGLSVAANSGNTRFTSPYLGEFQAHALATQLDAFVSKTLSCAPIARIFTKDLRKPDQGGLPTPNPFDTVYPYYKARANTTLYLSRTATDFTGGMFDVIKSNLFTIKTSSLPNLLASPGSAIVCWDRQGLWGTNSTNNANSLLSRLYRSSAFGLSGNAIASINALGQPGKASRIYAFIKRTNGAKEVKVYNLVYSNTSGTNYPPTYSVRFNQVYPPSR